MYSLIRSAGGRGSVTVPGPSATALVGARTGLGGRLPADKGCEPTLAAVLMFWVSEGAGPQGKAPRTHPMRGWRNRQTRWIQVPVPARAWGFNSPLAHTVETGGIHRMPPVSHARGECGGGMTCEEHLMILFVVERCADHLRGRPSEAPRGPRKRTGRAPAGPPPRRRLRRAAETRPQSARRARPGVAARRRR